MNYEEMSDFEINKKVSSAFLPCECIFDEGKKIVYLANIKDVMIGHSHEQILEPCAEFDPCNNPSDAWPIIVEHGTCLTSPTTGRKHQLWSASWNEDGGRWSHGDVTHGDKNPLRAACICFLKMKDAE